MTGVPCIKDAILGEHIEHRRVVRKLEDQRRHPKEMDPHHSPLIPEKRALHISEDALKVALIFMGFLMPDRSPKQILHSFSIWHAKEFHKVMEASGADDDDEADSSESDLDGHNDPKPKAKTRDQSGLDSIHRLTERAVAYRKLEEAMHETAESHPPAHDVAEPNDEEFGEIEEEHETKEGDDAAVKPKTQPDQDAVDFIKDELDGVGLAFSLNNPTHPDAAPMKSSEDTSKDGKDKDGPSGVYYRRPDDVPMTFVGLIMGFVAKHGAPDGKGGKTLASLKRLHILIPFLRPFIVMIQMACGMVGKNFYGQITKLNEAQVITKLLAMARAATPYTSMVQARHVVWFNYSSICHNIVTDNSKQSTDAIVPDKYRSYACRRLQVVLCQINDTHEVGLMMNVHRGSTKDAIAKAAMSEKDDTDDADAQAKVKSEPDVAQVPNRKLTRSEKVIRPAAFILPARLCRTVEVLPLIGQPDGEDQPTRVFKSNGWDGCRVVAPAGIVLFELGTVSILEGDLEIVVTLTDQSIAAVSKAPSFPGAPKLDKVKEVPAGIAPGAKSKGKKRQAEAVDAVGEDEPAAKAAKPKIKQEDWSEAFDEDSFELNPKGIGNICKYLDRHLQNFETYYHKQLLSKEGKVLFVTKPNKVTWDEFKRRAVRFFQQKVKGKAPCIY